MTGPRQSWVARKDAADRVTYTYGASKDITEQNWRNGELGKKRVL
jgi:hypothetical protein